MNSESMVPLLIRLPPSLMSIWEEIVPLLHTVPPFLITSPLLRCPPEFMQNTSPASTVFPLGNSDVPERVEVQLVHWPKELVEKSASAIKISGEI